MPKVRGRANAPEDSSLWEPQSPSISSLSFTTRAQPPLFPYIPLNHQHRYRTPPPLDPSLIESEQPTPDSSETSLARSPSFYLPLFEEPPPLPTSGTEDNPIVLDDVDINQGSVQPPEDVKATTSQRRSLRTPSRSATPRASPYPTTSPRSSSTSAASSSWTPTPKGKGKGKAARPRMPSTPTRTSPRKKNDFSPLVSSPLKTVAFSASDVRTPSASPAPEAVRRRFYIRDWTTPELCDDSDSSSSESED